MTIYEFADLPAADLQVDATYRGGRFGNASDAPLPRLLNVSNSGGFRYRGSVGSLELVVLVSSFGDPDWPDSLDRETGVLTYFGDNKEPGQELHSTPRRGNELLQRVFEDAHSGRDGRRKVPPILAFASTGEWRDVIFLGLAVPGTSDEQASEDLVAIWRTKTGRRFQNYRARFTVLDISTVSRTWITDIINGNAHSKNAPKQWLSWIDSGRRRALIGPRTLEYRSRAEQLPSGASGAAIIKAIHSHFSSKPHAFERCAGELARLMMPQIASLDLTRSSRDGGRDAIGTLRMGQGASAILLEFALEAKCYGPSNSVGVREMSRLISRLRHRQFGILVTTSWVDLQAYKEIKEDQHPIVIIAATDIANLLSTSGYSDARSVLSWLKLEFPVN